MFKAFFVVLIFLFSISSFAVEISKAIRESNNRIITAEAAKKDDGPFRCLECGGRLTLRKGQILAPHFAHKSDPNSSCSGGGPETWQHRQAKELIVDHLDQWVFIEKCPTCDKSIRTPTFPLAEGHTALIEHPFDRFKVDVMVLRNDANVVAVEIRHTHAVDQVKSEFFVRNELPIIEVDASQVIRAHESGRYRVGYNKVGNCPECEREERRKNSRPCLQCGEWQLKNELYQIEAPQGHKFRSAFVCEDCHDNCPSCGKDITHEDREKYQGCRACSVLQQTVQQMVDRNRIDLVVPFEDKDRAKACGARWDGPKKTWYCEIRQMHKCATWIHAAARVIPMVTAFRTGTPARIASEPLEQRNVSTKRDRDARPVAEVQGSALKRPAPAVAPPDPEKEKMERERFLAAQIEKEAKEKLLREQQQERIEQDRLRREKQRELEAQEFALREQREAERQKVLLEQRQRELEVNRQREEAHRLEREQAAREAEQARLARAEAQRLVERQRIEREEAAKRARKAEKLVDMARGSSKITQFFGKK